MYVGGKYIYDNTVTLITVHYLCRLSHTMQFVFICTPLLSNNLTVHFSAQTYYYMVQSVSLSVRSSVNMSAFRNEKSGTYTP